MSRKAYLIIRMKCPKCETFLSSPSLPLLLKAFREKGVKLEVVDLGDDVRAPFFEKLFPLGAKKLPALVYRGKLIFELDKKHPLHVISSVFGDVSFLVEKKKKR